MDELSAKASAGSLTPDEQTELDTLERLSCLLDIVHSKARRALKKKPKSRAVISARPVARRSAAYDHPGSLRSGRRPS
jgi:hypothetical protein